MSEMRPELLKEIRERANAATPGPWESDEKRGLDTIWLDIESDEEHEVLSAPALMRGEEVTEHYRQSVANVAFAAHARTDVPALCDALEAAWTERDTLALQSGMYKEDRDDARRAWAVMRGQRDALRKDLNDAPPGHQCPRCADFTESNTPALVRNLVDQRELAAYVLANPEDAGARMGLTDAVAEELAIRDEQGLAQLLEAARNHVMTDEEKAAQVESFAFGNTHLSNPEVTREGIREAMKKLGLAVKGK